VRRRRTPLWGAWSAAAKGYQLEKDQFIEVTKEELEELALESTRTIEIDEFVEKSEIDPRYLIRSYYLRPDGKVGHDAFAVIRETIREMDKVAIGRVVLTNREHIIALHECRNGSFVDTPPRNHFIRDAGEGGYVRRDRARWLVKRAEHVSEACDAAVRQIVELDHPEFDDLVPLLVKAGRLDVENDSRSADMVEGAV
jgi:hypothetical protein